MNLPQRWLDVLRALHASGFTEAFIGGGALRDLDNERDVKDVDIFVRHRGDETLAMLEQAFGYQGSDDTPNGAAQGYLPDIDPDVIGIFGFSHSQRDVDLFEPMFNVISCGGPEDDMDFMVHHLNRFDLGICKIVHDGRELFMGKDYITDRMARTITITHDRCLSRSTMRASRIRDRAYLTWKIRNPYDHSFDVVSP